MSREVVNLTERKVQHNPVKGVKEFVCLSFTNFGPNYFRIGNTEWSEIFFNTSKPKSYVKKVSRTRGGIQPWWLSGLARRQIQVDGH